MKTRNRFVRFYLPIMIIAIVTLTPFVALKYLSWKHQRAIASLTQKGY